MKRLVLLVSMIALLAGCAKIEEINQPLEDQTQTEIEITDSELPEVIYASVIDDEDDADPKTRTYVSGEDGKSILWNQNDEISYFTATKHLVYDYLDEDGASRAELYLSLDTGYNLEHEIRGTAGLYPFNFEATCYDIGIAPEGVEPPCVHQIVTEFPSVQTYAEKSFGRDANIMVASSEQENETDLFFRNACGYLIIKLYAEDERRINSIRLEAFNDVKIAGRVFINASSDEAPKVMMDSDNSTSVVTLDCYSWENGVTLGTTKETATEFWFALPPTNLTGGIKITATDSNGNQFIKQTTKDITIPRNQIQPMAALKLESVYQMSILPPED